MNRLETLVLVNQMRHRELLQQAEKERLLKQARKNQAGYYNPGLNISKWLRSRLHENNNRGEYSSDCPTNSEPCCTGIEL